MTTFWTLIYLSGAAYTIFLYSEENLLDEMEINFYIRHPDASSVEHAFFFFVSMILLWPIAYLKLQELD
jgi:hypothetical protein